MWTLRIKSPKIWPDYRQHDTISLKLIAPRYKTFLTSVYVAFTSEASISNRLTTAREFTAGEFTAGNDLFHVVN